MEDSTIPSSLLNPNLIDKTAQSATDAVDATKVRANAVLDAVSDKVESVRSTLSPALDNAFAPLDAVVSFTRRNPLTALSAAMGVGAVLYAVFGRRRG